MNCWRKWRLSLFTKSKQDEQRENTKKPIKQRPPTINRTGLSKIEPINNDAPQWENDYALNSTYDQFLFDEYLEMGMLIFQVT